jgi:predicted RecB family endonuclease
MRTGHAVELSVFPLVSLIRKQSLGEPHAVFAGGELYVSHRLAAEAERALQQELGDHREIIELLNVVQRATFEYYGWVTSVDDHYGVLVASLGRQAVSLVRNGESVRFERCDADRLAEALVLPDAAAGRGETVSVSHADFHSSRAPGTVMRRTAPSRPPTARRLDALLNARRVAVTKLYAARRDEDGVRQRSERWLTLLDLVDGRWVLSVGHARREKWINATPGTPRVVADGLAELARSIR